ncbi:hypothetical protein KAH81_02590 [bacterium]|nr:hypothetical protein [bacterium]
MEIMTFSIVVLLVIVGVIFIVRLHKIEKKKNRELLTNIATELNATIDFGDWKTQPIFRGKTGDNVYEITFHVVSTGKSQIKYLDIKTPFESTDLHLCIRRYGSGSKILNKLGMGKQIETGDSAFDSAVKIKGEPESRLQALAYDWTFKDAALNLIKRNFSVDFKPPFAVASKVYSKKKDMVSQILQADIKHLIDLSNICR